MSDPIVTLNEESLKTDLRELVRRTVEDTLNGLLEEEAGDLVGAERHRHTTEREAYCASRCDRSLATSSGEVAIRMSKPEGMRFTTAIVERFRRRETSVEETIIETCLAGVSARRFEDVSEGTVKILAHFPTVPSRFLRTFRQPHRPALRCGYSSSSVTSR